MKEKFIDKQFSKKSLELIATAEEIINDYLAQGFRLSLRQLYYQFVSRNAIVNEEKSYKNLGNVIADARTAGLLDWDAIEDRGREVKTVAHWTNPADILESAAYSFHIDKWLRQTNYVTVMVEKDALSGVLEPVSRELDIAFTANRGYSSASALYELGKTLRHQRRQGKQVHVIYLGDHDPSGIDMTRDVEERLELFSRGEVCVHRIALNMSQVNEYNPPENPAKLTDSRAQDYINRFGFSSWELDALNPTVLADLVREMVYKLRDEEVWGEDFAKEKGMRGDLSFLVKEFKEHGKLRERPLPDTWPSAEDDGGDEEIEEEE